MTSKLRRMKVYHPRKRKTKVEINRQILHDLQHKISSNVGSLLVLMKEGRQGLAEEAQQRARSDFLKIAPQMKQTAQLLGDKYSVIVKNYLNTVDLLIHSKITAIDPLIINECYTVTQQLENELKVA